MFINPMWDSENQRLGKRRCTPLGYRLHEWSDLVGFLALLVLLATFAYLKYRDVAGSFDSSLWWLLAVPFSLALAGTLLHSYSWRLARSKGFQYDFQTQETSWREDGRRIVFEWRPGKDAHVE
jgi:hypothetical protein